MSHRTVAIFTGNRAEYGLQYPILRAVSRHPALEYRLLVSGAHLDPNFGRTLDEIRTDGFRVDAEIKIEMDASSLLATAHAIGSGVIAISSVLAELMPDIVVVYADRFEGLAKYPACRDYVARATARPSFVKAHADQMAHFAAADAA